ncbi:MAG TPA: alpha/beta fold hydrolase [Solirubrobacterales bacterium]|jgi:alpha-beta hydrolase superfamily lysophospholipase|nr:alpha/beta fold hydrolase [Solirubrobacterales bacterium]
MEREELEFDVAGDGCAAWLYPAATASPPAPIVVMAHGLSGTRRDGLGPFAQRFAAAGLAALVFDHRGFGDSGGEPDLFDPARQLEDWRAAIARARSLPGIDPERVATFGSSMGGGNALAAAAGDRRIAAAISQVPFLDLMRQAHRSSPRVSALVLWAALRGRHLPAVGQPHEAALINAPGGEEGWRHVVAIGEDSRWRNRVSTRWLLGRPYRPARHAAGLHCPWLLCVGEADRVARPGPAIAAAKRAPLGELRTYPGVDHFDVYDGPEHEAVVADQLEFLRRQLLAGR